MKIEKLWKSLESSLNRIFPVGTRSTLWGVHAFWYHPFSVWLAWRRVHRRWPTLAECVCIALHDIAYWGKPNLDGPEGKLHPTGGAQLACKIVWWLYYRGLSKMNGIQAFNLCLFHSSYMAELYGRPVSALYLPDKVSILFDPPLFYLFRARLSGELKEFVDNGPSFVGSRGSWAWHSWYVEKVKNKLKEHEQNQTVTP